jgi:hypothetical protein
MILALTCAAGIAFAQPQTINGVKQVFDPTPKYARAILASTEGDANADKNPDMFVAGFFAMKVKTMIPLVQTKYTSAQIGICGTLLGFYDEGARTAISTAKDRIMNGTKDFDSFTEEEKKSIGEPLANPKSVLYPFDEKKGKSGLANYMAGASLGSLCGYMTLWHISPTNASLLKYIGEAVDSCAELPKKADIKLSADVLAGFKGFEKFKGKTYDAATMGEISKQLESTLKSSLPAQYRWE